MALLLALWFAAWGVAGEFAREQPRKPPLFCARTSGTRNEIRAMVSRIWRVKHGYLGEKPMTDIHSFRASW
jgi:hypothetical protein